MLGDEQSIFVEDDPYDGDNDSRSTEEQASIRPTERAKPSAEANVALRLPFHHKILQDMMQEDGLLVLGRGLGILDLTTAVIHSLDVAGTDPENKENSLVLVIGAHDGDYDKLTNALTENYAFESVDNDQDDQPQQPMHRRLTLVTEKMDPRRRAAAYRQGGVFCVTSRILVVDMLSSNIDRAKITGVVVLHAHEVQAASNTDFVLQLYREANKQGFLKALSDEPERLSSGFSPLATHMKSLHAPRVWLWPRFHVQVTDTLNSHKKRSNQVVEIQVEMTPMMAQIQTALRECIEMCLAQIRRSVKEVDTESWTFDQALHRDFVRRLRAQLESVWHMVSYKTRNLINDVSTLFQLLEALTVKDCISFLRDLDAIQMSSVATNALSREVPPWLLEPSGDIVFNRARLRVFPSNKDGPIEELPKLDQLISVLDEISQSATKLPGPILVMCHKHQTAMQLQQYLASYDANDPDSTQRYMQRRRAWYLSWKRGTATARSKLETNETVDGQAIQQQQQQQVLSARAAPTRAPMNKRRRVRGGGALSVGERESPVSGGDSLPAESDLNMDLSLVTDLDDGIEVTGTRQVAQEDGFEVLKMDSMVVIRVYDPEEDDVVLSDLEPSTVIMYEPEPSFIRRVEIYRATKAAIFDDESSMSTVQVYFMHYKDSVEEQRFLFNVRREKDAFSRLIKERANMPIRLHDEVHDSSSMLRKVAPSSRVAGGQVLATAERPRIVVDVREFRSSLPYMLHSRGFELVPRTLQVGDYVLSPQMCVERKSIPDLVASLNSGRLLEQCKRMRGHYDMWMLLIEFSEQRSFTFEPFTEISHGPEAARLASDNIQQRLALLMLHYPDMRIVWSPAPHQTADIFSELKMDQPEPPTSEAELLSNGGAVLLENEAAINMLRAVPGVTSKNYGIITRNIKSMRALSQASVDDLAKLVGRESAARIVRFFQRNLRE